MKNIFKKSHIPFLKHVLHEGKGRDNWNLARVMQDKDGLQHQLPAEIALFSRGASQGDAWSMCEAARLYFNHCGDLFLPQAKSYYKTTTEQSTTLIMCQSLIEFYRINPLTETNILPLK